MKIRKMLMGISVMGLVLTGCGKSDSSSSGKSDNSIHVVSRENGSGTRDAFVEITGVLEKDSSGNKVDNTTKDAIIQNSTESVMSTVQNDKNAIGYISLGSLSDVVKAVKVDGVEPTKDNIKNKSYKLQRPFLIAYQNGKLSAGAKDFLKFLASQEASTEIEKDGYISIDKGTEFETSKPKGKLSISGSTSVTPLMEKLVEKYGSLNPDLEIEIQSNGSSAGISDALAGVADLAMSSRDLKPEEKLETYTLALDGIAIIANNESKVESISLDNIKSVYTGKIVEWSEVE